MARSTKSSHRNSDGTRTTTSIYQRNDGSGSSHSTTVKPGMFGDKHISSSSSKWGPTKK